MKTLILLIFLQGNLMTFQEAINVAESQIVISGDTHNNFKEIGQICKVVIPAQRLSIYDKEINDGYGDFSQGDEQRTTEPNEKFNSAGIGEEGFGAGLEWR